MKATQRCAFCPSTSTSGGSLCGGLGRRAAPPSSATGAGAGAVAGLSTPGIRWAAQPPAPALLRRPERRGGSAAVSAWRGSRCCHLPRHDGRRRRAARGCEGARVRGGEGTLEIEGVGRNRGARGPHRHNKMRLPAATASSSPLEWKAMQETTKSKWCRQRHCLVLTSQMRTVWSSEPEASRRLLCGWNLTVHGVRSWPVSTHSTVHVAQRNTCPGRGGRDHAATRDRAASLHTAVAAASGGAREAGGTRPPRHSARARRRTPACPPPRPRGACWGV